MYVQKIGTVLCQQCRHSSVEVQGSGPGRTGSARVKFFNSIGHP